MCRLLTVKNQFYNIFILEVCRDLFPEESFQENKIAGMNLKRFKKGGDQNSDQLLKWIEEGCFDALKKKYLKSAILTILADTTSPNNVLETYTLRVNYPDSPLHQTIDATAANIAQLSLTRNDKSVLNVESSPANFKEAVSKILRSLCVMSQTLKSLPMKKCLSMKLTYYEETTPLGYEPPGFVAAEFDIDHLFQGPTSKYSFGKAVTPFHNIGLSMETMCDDNVRPNKANSTTINSQALVFPQSQVVQPEDVMAGNTINVQDGIDFNESIMIASQVAQPANSAPKFPVSQEEIKNPVIPATPSNPIESVKPVTKVPFNDLSIIQQQLQIIRCTCGYNMKDLEMLQCGSCTNWQHSVCAGYVSCRDRRLEGSLYLCYYCQYGDQINTFRFIQKLSKMRKALAIISAEGFESVVGFSNRMGLSATCGQNLKDRLVQEKFLIQTKKRKYEIAKKDEYIKERIKFYFNQNLNIHSEFVEAQARDKGKGNEISKRKTLESDEEIEKGPSHKDAPIEIGNTMPFEVTESTKETNKDIDNVNSKSIVTPMKASPAQAMRTPPESAAALKKKRKISIPASRISCYMNDS